MISRVKIIQLLLLLLLLLPTIIMSLATISCIYLEKLAILTQIQLALSDVESYK